MEGEARGKGRKREEKGGGGGVRAGVAGEDQTRAPSCHYNFEDSAIANCADNTKREGLPYFLTCKCSKASCLQPPTPRCTV